LSIRELKHVRNWVSGQGKANWSYPAGAALLLRAFHNAFAYAFPLRAMDRRCRRFGCYHWPPDLPDGGLLLDDFATHTPARLNQKGLGYAASFRLLPSQSHNDCLVGSTIRCGHQATQSASPHQRHDLHRMPRIIESHKVLPLCIKALSQPPATSLGFTLEFRSLAQSEISVTMTGSTELLGLTHGVCRRNVDAAHGFDVPRVSFATSRWTLAISLPAGAAAS
ncbi:hypothetical protein CI238_00035, partial [Colletotrichum incanum]